MANIAPDNEAIQTGGVLPLTPFNGLCGRIKWFDALKGYGFIVGPGGEDVFVHYTEIKASGFRSLEDNDLVEYDLVRNSKGLSAKYVVRINDMSNA